MSVRLHTTTEIAASPERVWSVLSDLAACEQWNPFIPSARGTLAEGERLVVRIQPPEGKATRFRPTVKAVQPNRELRWLRRLGMGGIFDGEHRFAIEPTATGSRFTHEERFSGVLGPLSAKGLRRRYLPALRGDERRPGRAGDGMSALAGLTTAARLRQLAYAALTALLLASLVFEVAKNGGWAAALTGALAADLSLGFGGGLEHAGCTRGPSRSTTRSTGSRGRWP